MGTDVHPGKRKINNTLCATLRCAPFFVCCLSALLITTFSGSMEWSLHLLTAPLLLLLIISLATVALPKALRITLQILLGEAILLVCLVECYCIYEFESLFTPRILSLIVNTDARETGEFFSTYVSTKIFRSWSITIVVLLIILLPLSYLIERRICKRAKEEKGHFFFVFVLVMVALISFETPAAIRFTHLLDPHTTQQESEMQMFEGAQDNLTTPLHRLAFSWHVMKLSEKTIAAIHRSCREATIDDCSYRSPHIVLVIGESYNKHHSSLYGYHLPTTPRQQQRSDNGELTVFHDAVAPWNITNNVLMSIFSLWDNSCGDDIGNYPMLPVLLRRAGYKVRFATNQFQLRGLRKGFSNKAGHFFLSDRTLSDSLFDYRNNKTTTYDMDLVNRLVADEAIGRDSSYSLDIIHLIGQHFEYNKRYPAEKAHFSLSDYGNRNLDNEAKENVMHYDNATYYNDLVMDSVLQIYEGMEAIVIYLSDHGDEVWDDDSTHTRTFQTPGKTAARNEYEVPFWIWCSESYRERHPDIVEQIRNAVERPLLTDDLPQLILYLAGIKSRWNRDERNILSPSYQHKTRLIDGNTDYDQLQ